MDTSTATTIAPVSTSVAKTSLSGSVLFVPVVTVDTTTALVTTVITTALQEPVTKVATITDLTTTTNYAIL